MTASHSSAPRQRVRLLFVQTEATPDSRCAVRVELEWAAGTRVQGIGRGNATRQGMLIAGSLATLNAVREVTGERLDLEFRGAKAVRAFDALVVIVALRGRADDRRYNLIGSSEATEEEVARGGVLAMLDATNRILERYAKS